VKKADKSIVGALSAGGTIQFAFWFLAAIVGIIVAGYANLATGFRIALGAAAFGFVVCLSVAFLPLLPDSLKGKARAPTVPQPRPAGAAPATDSPLARAALLQHGHDQRVANERRALREVREELRDNGDVIQNSGIGDLGIARHLSVAKWQLYEGTLLDMDDGAPLVAARAAYRELKAVARSEENDTDSDGKYVGLRGVAQTTTLKAINDAIKVMDEVEASKSSRR
jgi:hypothetical protein